MTLRLALLSIWLALPVHAHAAAWQVSANPSWTGQEGTTGIQWWLAEDTPLGPQIGGITTIPGPLAPGVWTRISDAPFLDSGRTICAIARAVRTRGSETIVSLDAASVCQTFSEPPPPEPPPLIAPDPPLLRLEAATPPVDPPPAPTGGPPLSWDDARFANSTTFSTQSSNSAFTFSDRTSTVSGEPATIRCGASCTLRRVRVSSREALRVVRGDVVVEDSWLEARGIGDDHADTIQTYSPGSGGTITLRRSMIRAYTGSATAGFFIADDWGPATVTIEDTVFWGGPYGIRFHTDGNAISVSLSNVCFVGPFGTAPTRFLVFEGGGFTYPRWENVHNCTIVNGQLVRGTAIQRP